MKYLTIFGITAVTILSSFRTGNAIQKRYSDIPIDPVKPWTLGLNVGVAGSISESIKITSLESPGVHMNIKYMVNHKLGIMALGGYNALATNSSNQYKSQYVYATFELAYSLSGLNNKSSVIFHTGPGVGTMWNAGYKSNNPSDPFLKNQDDVINLNVGITPQFAVAKNVLLNVDFSYANNFMQDHNFDYTNRPRSTAMMYNMSAGLVFQLNHSKSHLSIIPTVGLKDTTMKTLPEQLDSAQVISFDTVVDTLEFKGPDVVEVMSVDTAEDTLQVERLVIDEVIGEETDSPVDRAYKVGDDLGKLFDITPIRYALAKSEISEESKRELDKLVVIMRDNADLCVELGSHTDSRASAAFNQKLSESRAKAAYDYVTARGVDASRIGYKGYGETNILNKCLEGVPCSDEEHLVNRRTEIIVRGIVPCTPIVRGAKLQYRIQFTMSQTQIPVKTFTDKGMGSVYEYQHDGNYKYCTDKVFSSRAKALNELSRVRGLGYSDAFIAVFQNGGRVK
jgi:outer membrane protein OmpA-like peptidoglycan-associated protein